MCCCFQSGQGEDAAAFSDLYRRMTQQEILRKRWAIMLLLFTVGQNKPPAFGNIDADSVVTSTPSMGLPALDSVISGSAAVDGPSAVPFNRQRTLVAGGRDNGSKDIRDLAIVRDILYIFQGIDGKYVRFDPIADTYMISPETKVPCSISDIVSKLAELGWLFTRVQRFARIDAGGPSIGLVERAFCSALHTELSEYFRLLSVLEAQIKAQSATDATTVPPLTLRRLVVWTREPLARMRTLATLVDGCKGLKGGALARELHTHAKHGDLYTRDLIERTMKSVNRPIYDMLHRWIYEGELDDPHHEFFVANDLTVSLELFWEKKYSLRTQMIPLFVPVDAVGKILLIGKSINFIRHAMDDNSSILDRTAVESLTPTEGMDAYTAETLLRSVIDRVYCTVCRRVLDLYLSKFKFMEHLGAMRRYLLLGQGDFVKHLMDLLAGDLARPASGLYLHNLSSTLETAIRATNAQYDSADVLERLDVKLFEVSPGDNGWDVFSLTYQVNGPICAVFNRNAMQKYLRIFNFLWRTKRMEFVLATMYSKQITDARELGSIEELKPCLQQVFAMQAAMSHFVNQIQHYFMFEVLECSWDELTTALKTSPDLDHVITAHNKFLNTVSDRIFLGSDSKGMLSQLRSIFDIINTFQKAHAALYDAGVDELQRRLAFEGRAYANSEAGNWGTVAADSDGNDASAARFLSLTLSGHKAKIDVIARQFQGMTGRFLTMLTTQSDPSLRFLSFRIDFNEYYRRVCVEFDEACSPFPAAKRKARRDIGGSKLSNPNFAQSAII